MFRVTKGLTAGKLRQVVMLASALSLLLASLVFTSFDVMHRRRDGVRQARLIVSLTASRLDLAVRGNGIARAGRVLARLKSEPAGLTAMFERYLRSPVDGDAANEHAEDMAGLDQPIDSDALLNRREGDRELLGEMVRLLESEMATLLEQVRRALRRKGFAALQRVAHTLKGAVDNFGAGPAFRAAEEPEAAARAGSKRRAATVCDTLENELKRLLESLEPFRAGVPE